MRDDLAASYKLANDVDLTAYLATGAGYAKWGNLGWEPIGTYFPSAPFTGSFDGTGHKITGLRIARFNNAVGLFGITSGAVITNLGVEIAAAGVMGGNPSTGGLVGWQDGGSITNSYTTGDVYGSNNSGGLVGRSSGSITASYATGNVSGGSPVGGLVGWQDGGSIAGSHATGSVTAFIDPNLPSGSSSISEAGGLVGRSGGSIAGSYATGDVSGDAIVGGLVGLSSDSIATSYATGNVTGNSDVGGLVGEQGGSIANSYASGNVTGSFVSIVGYVSDIGGLVGLQYQGSSIVNSYASGSVGIDPGNLISFGYSGVGGLVGRSSGIITASFFDSTVNPAWDGVGYIDSGTGYVTGKTTMEMMTQSTFATVGWDFTGVWSMPLVDYPKLLPWQPPAPSGSKQFTSPVPVGTGTMTAQITGGGAGCVFNPTATQMTVPSGNPPFQMPYGLFAFELVGCTPGSQVTVTTTWPSLSGVTGYMKYGKTPTSAGQSVWYAPANVQLVGNTITYTVRDGGLGDDDLSADGVIRDPGGPVGGPLGGGTTAVPTLGEWALALLALMLAGAAARRRV